MISEKIELSVVIGIYNAAGWFPQLYRRLIETLSGVVGSFEIIAVLDGCTDDSAEVVESYCKEDDRLRLVELSRNFGQQVAITAGLQFASGEMVVVMDDDLEDPPEVIPEFVAKAQEGYDVVYGIRKRRKRSPFHRMSYYIFYRVLNRLTDIDMPYDAGDFCLIKRPVVQAINAMPERGRYVRGLRTWAGFNQIGIKYERGKRAAGESTYSMFRYLNLALDGILSFSYKPLLYVSVMGIVIALVSFLLGLRLIILKLLGKITNLPGWVSLMVIVLFIGGIQLISIGVVGQYIARIYEEVKERPSFIVKRVIGFPKED